MIIETTETAARIHRKLYQITCPGCGREFTVFHGGPEMTCRECGAVIPLDNAHTHKVFAQCSCGGYVALRTNAGGQDFEVRCPVCRKSMTTKWSRTRNRYEYLLVDPAQKKPGKDVRCTEREARLLSLMVLHDKFGFGRDRAARFIAHMASLVEEYRTGEVTLQDITDALTADGIKIEEDR